MIPHHFSRRGDYDWDDPVKLVDSLLAQLEQRFLDQQELGGRRAQSPCGPPRSAMTAA
jgi:hypothetical protein